MQENFIYFAERRPFDIKCITRARPEGWGKPSRTIQLPDIVNDMRGQIVIRRVRPEENESVHAMVQSIADETFVGLFATPHVPIGQAQWWTAWLAVSNHEIVAVTMTTDEWVNDLWVRRSSRRLGVGSKLLAHAEAEIRERGHETFRLRVVESNTPAVRFIRAGDGACTASNPHEKFGHGMYKMRKHSATA